MPHVPLLNSLGRRFRVFASEPPFRLFVRQVLKLIPTSVRTDAEWELETYPGYWVGVLAAADQASRQGVRRISVLEFGVARGHGLIALERCARAVEKETGVSIAVYGFDIGTGMPPLCGDFRDHPDQWMVGDYPMDIGVLQDKLSDRTELIVGDFRNTVSAFALRPGLPPVGFASIDVDLYSSTCEALKLFSRSDRKLLIRTILYFDDVAYPVSHRFAGELLAIQEFNEASEHVKIDIWRGLRANRIFQGGDWIEKMYVAHDLEAIGKTAVNREPKDFAFLHDPTDEV